MKTLFIIKFFGLGLTTSGLTYFRAPLVWARCLLISLLSLFTSLQSSGVHTLLGRPTELSEINNNFVKYML